MKILLVTVAIVLILAVILGISGCNSYNGIVGSAQAVDRQWGQVQNVYQRRSDLVPNLVATVQGAATFEKSTLTDVIKARAAATSVNISATAAPTSQQQLQQFEQAQGELSRSLGRLLVTVERYPELKSNQNFLTLQAQLEGTENRIATERGRFNEVVQAYNTKVQQFPTVIVARMGGFTPRPYFSASAQAQNAPQVQFDFGNNASKTPATAPAP